MPASFVVLRQTGHDQFEFVAEVERRPGLPARKARRAAIVAAIGGEPAAGETYAAILRSEWRIGFDW
ncbi:hypothetical protein [Fodinicola acaciae]|uniref:hypothetical protein n=1 Tax=Fodinicola acaciae TaxID=2681555 RepID=UPI0013D4D6C3|nr:hypothetical protein [Fodinicola acaciae]